MDRYVALVGYSNRKALNGLWAALKDKKFEPDELLIIWDENSESIDYLEEDIKKILKSYGLDCPVKSKIFSEIEDVRHLIEENSDEEKGLKALDISSASKYITAKVLMSSSSDMFDHVFCLEVNGEEDRPLPTIENNKVKLHDLKSEEKGGI